MNILCSWERKKKYNKKQIKKPTTTTNNIKKQKQSKKQKTKRKSIMLSPFMSQKTVCITFLTDYCARNLFFTGEWVYFRSMDCLFRLRLVVINPFLAHL